MDTLSQSSDVIKLTFNIPVSVEQAFEVFTNELDSWWPKEYTWSGRVLDTVKIEPFQGGRCFERGPHGFECDWGRVLTWAPPNQIIFTWQISPDRVPEPDPEKVSEVELSFSETANEKTFLKFEHRNLNKHGENAESYKQALNSPQGWLYIFNCYIDKATR